MATKKGPGGQLLIATIGPPVQFSSQKVPPTPTAKCVVLARLWDIQVKV